MNTARAPLDHRDREQWREEQARRMYGWCLNQFGRRAFRLTIREVITLEGGFRYVDNFDAEFTTKAHAAAFVMMWSS